MAPPLGTVPSIPPWFVAELKYKILMARVSGVPMRRLRGSNWIDVVRDASCSSPCFRLQFVGLEQIEPDSGTTS